MSESKSPVGDYHEMVDIWARIEAFDQVSRFVPFNLQLVLCKRLTLSAASVFVTDGLFICIYFLLFEENHQNWISRAGEKFSPTISLFLRKMIAWVSKFSCAKRFKGWTFLWYNSESSKLAGSKLPSFHVCLHSFQCIPDQNNRFG